METYMWNPQKGGLKMKISYQLGAWILWKGKLLKFLCFSMQYFSFLQCILLLLLQFEMISTFQEHHL